MSKNELASYVKAFESYRITASKWVHLVRSRHFPSRDKDGRHTIVSAIPENHMLCANLMVLSSIETELWAMEVDFAGIGIFYHYSLL